VNSLLLATAARADENDDLAQELGQFHKDAEKILRQLQQKATGLNGDSLRGAREKAMRLATDDKFLSSVKELWSHPSRNTLLGAEVVFLLVMLFVKAWRQARAGNWFTKVLWSLFLSLFTWVGIVLILPYFILGEPFRVVVSTLWRVFSS
jgi:hypothetical protein